MSQSSFKQLSILLKKKKDQLLDHKSQSEDDHGFIVEQFMHQVLLRQKFEDNCQKINKFVHYMSQKKFCKLSPDVINKNMDEISFGVYSDFAAINFNPQKKAYCIYGKALNVYRRKNKKPLSDKDQQLWQQATINIENTIFQLMQLNLYPLPKNESHQDEDVLMQYHLPESNLQPVHLSTQVFSPFVPLPFAVIMFIPIKPLRNDALCNFIKGTLLHIYFEQIPLISKIASKEPFYKNSKIKGIYFIQEGQVEATSGRIVARGWVTNGICKSSGLSWRFKPLPFFKFIIRNQNIWKQFVNDLLLNNQYPFKMSNLMNLEDQPDFTKFKKKNKRITKLPRIGHSSFDYAKMVQIEKVKHFDDRINDICQYKQKIAMKRGGGGQNKLKIEPIVARSSKQSKHQSKLLNCNSSRSMVKSLHSHKSSENILIMSVLKKLEVLADQNPIEDTKKEIQNQKRNMRIGPMYFYQKHKFEKKNNRYNRK